MLRPTKITLDEARLKNNISLLKAWNGSGNFFCPMVKANAYGHGASRVSRILEQTGVSALGVALVEEGVALRQRGITAPILSFGPLTTDAAKVLVEHQLTPVAGRFEDLTALAHAVGEGPLKLHLKFNTGMNRLGFDEAELPGVQQFFKAHPQWTVEGVCTHLSHGDEIDLAEGPSRRQLRALAQVHAHFPKAVAHGHKSASLCTLRRLNIAKTDHVGARPGISIYGLPHDGNLSGPGLEPILRFTTAVIRVHEVAAGEAVSYGARWVAARRSFIGVLPVGYGDGYMRALSNRAHVLLRGERVPVVGSVCMDYTLVDLTDVKNGLVNVGEEVVLLGRQGQNEVTAAELAELAGTIGYEIVTALGPRVAREDR